MDRCPRLLAIAAILMGVAVWLVAPPVGAAQSDSVAIELNFITTTGAAPEGGVSVLDLSTGIEYRNAGVAFGDPIEVAGEAGVTSRFEIRRTELRPDAVACDGAVAADATPTSRATTITITPGSERVVCTITLTDQLPLTGPTLSNALIGVMWLGGGALMVAVSRVSRD